jgi:ribonuclease BN (tRNA processing enzyme)
MEIEVLGGFGGEALGCRTTSLLIDDALALDAGSLARVLSVERQLGVRSVLLSHSHLDHVSSLPFFIENIYGHAHDPIDIYASAATLAVLHQHLFNDALWPDFTRLPDHVRPAMRLRELEAEVPVEIEGVRITPIPVNHPVPTFGYLLERDGAAVLWSSDTGPTERLWQVANDTPGLRAVCLEISFDDSMQQIADLSGHLTPRSAERELAKLERPVPVLLHHLKPPCIDAIRYEVRRLKNPRIGYLEQGRSYDFS